MEPCDITLLNKLQAIPQLNEEQLIGYNRHVIHHNEHALRCESETMAEFIRRNGMWNAYLKFLKDMQYPATRYPPEVFNCLQYADDCARERSQGRSHLWDYDNPEDY